MDSDSEGTRSEAEEADPESEVINHASQDNDTNIEQGGSNIYSDNQAPTSNPSKIALEAEIYDIVPTIAAPHSTSINTICSTPDLQWIFSGGSDGYIRKYNWRDTISGKSMLTVAQRHPFVDSVTKAGVLTTYWPNSDASTGKPADDVASLSPVYSLAVQRQSLWLLSGLEGGGINLQSVRHDEGKRIMTLRGHTSAVSVLNLAKDEKSFLSGSWDKNVLDWDLNTGKTIRVFEGSTGQISTLEMRPESVTPIPETSDSVFNLQDKPGIQGSIEPKVNGLAEVVKDTQTTLDSDELTNGPLASPTDSLFGGNDADSLFGDSENIAAQGAFDVDDENDFSRAIASDLQDKVQKPPSSSQDAQSDIVMAETEKAVPEPSLDSDDLSKPVTIKDLDAPAIKDMPEADHSTPLKVDRGSDERGEASPDSGSVFLAASFDGSIRIWDKRQRPVIARLEPQNVPPWCMNACWSPDGNVIFAGRRNGTVDEYNIHKGLSRPCRNFKLPNNSGAVSAVKAMPNGRHLICASYDILRLYDLHEKQIFKHATVPFLIIPGHRTSIVSQLFIDPSARYLISAAGNRGWEGMSSEVLLGYEINVPS